MALTSAQDIIVKALQKIGVAGENETPSNSAISGGLDSLNAMLGSWSVDGLLVTSRVQEDINLVKGTAEYTIGVGQTANTAKPLAIVGGYVRTTANADYGITVVPRDIYNQQIDKDSEGTPSLLYYDPGVPQQANQAGTIKLFPSPDDNHTLTIVSDKELTEFSAANETVTFQTFYKRAMIFNLALELAPDYGIVPNPVVVKNAEDSLRAIRNINARNNRIVSKINLPGCSHGYNYYSE
jgi:hypothetical protein